MWLDIDLLIVAPEFDGTYDRAWIDLLWTLRATTDTRIEPLPVGEKQWQEDDDNMLIAIARSEGEQILLPVAV